jgi:hypothetical protein
LCRVGQELSSVSLQLSPFQPSRLECEFFVVQLNRGRRHVVLDASALDAGVKVVSQIALEFAVQFAPEKGGMVSYALQ